MRLSPEQLTAYEQDGFLLLPNYFSGPEIDAMKTELPALMAEDTPRRVIENDGQAVRSIYGSHMSNEVFSRLARHPRVVQPANQILGSDIYVHQFKINTKRSFGGDIWEWHQDYIFWRQEDGLPAARLTNVAIFLDEMTEFNGPLFVIPGSHTKGVIDVPAQDRIFSNGKDGPGVYRHSPSWISNLTAAIKYSVDKETVAELVKQYGLVALKGPVGSVIFFDCNLVHASPSNISPFERVIIIISYNSVENTPSSESPRPDFICGRDFQPLVAVSDDALMY